jgi:urease accessory protein
MLIEQVLGNAAEAGGAIAAPAADILDVTWEDCLRRAFRGRTRAGAAVRVLLPLAARLGHGDVLLRFTGGEPLLVLNVQPCELLVARAASPAKLVTLAFELGNLHAPIQLLGDDALATLPDGPVEALLADVGVAYRVERRRFEPQRSSVLARPIVAGTFEIRPPLA